jgi:DNA-binding XRE family transcriptional regulator
MAEKKARGKVEWTAEDRARHKAVREKFKDWHPSLEELLATGDYEGPIPLAEYFDIRKAVADLKAAREEAGLSLAEVAERSGIDKAALSRLESGQHLNPTVNTLGRYARAVGKRWVCLLTEP